MPGGVRKARRDDTDFTEYAEGGKVGLYANINAKKKRIAEGSGEKMRKVGSKGAPTKADFIKSLKQQRSKPWQPHPDQQYLTWTCPS
jgi:hypothetical protein